MMKQHTDGGHFFIRGFLFCIYVLSSAWLALRVRSCVYNCVDKHHLALTIAECFVGITVPISAYHAWEHLTNFVRPRLQSQIVRIIWMVPIYSFESLLSISFMEHAFYFQAFREIYESYVIYCFMRFLLHFLGDGRNLTERLASMPASMGYHKPPFCWLQPWQMGADFLRRCKAGVFQFVIVRFLLAVLTLFLRIIECYDEGNYDSNSSFLWITIICCCSQSWALYSLFMFYHCSHKELITMRPFMKFLCIKMVIFFCWWQALAICVLVKLGHINSSHGHSVQEVADLIQDLLISMEMLVASIAFFNSFPIMEFATVRQLSWGSPAITPSVTPGGGSGVQTPDPYSSNKKKASVAMAGIPGSTVISMKESCIGTTLPTVSNDEGENTANGISSGQQKGAIEKLSFTFPEPPKTAHTLSPRGDSGKSPTSSSSRKVFLPYVDRASVADTTDQTVFKDTKRNPELKLGTKSGKNRKRIKERSRSDLKAVKWHLFDLTSPLAVLHNMGVFTLKTLLPSFLPPALFTTSITGKIKLLERYDSVGDVLDVEDSSSDSGSDPEVSALIRRGLMSTSYDSSESISTQQEGELYIGDNVTGLGAGGERGGGGENRRGPDPGKDGGAEESKGESVGEDGGNGKQNHGQQQQRQGQRLYKGSKGFVSIAVAEKRELSLLPPPSIQDKKNILNGTVTLSSPITRRRLPSASLHSTNINGLINPLGEENENETSEGHSELTDSPIPIRSSAAKSVHDNSPLGHENSGSPFAPPNQCRKMRNSSSADLELWKKNQITPPDSVPKNGMVDFMISSLPNRTSQSICNRHGSGMNSANTSPKKEAPDKGKGNEKDRESLKGREKDRDKEKEKIKVKEIERKMLKIEKKNSCSTDLYLKSNVSPTAVAFCPPPPPPSSQHYYPNIYGVTHNPTQPHCNTTRDTFRDYARDSLQKEERLERGLIRIKDRYMGINGIAGDLSLGGIGGSAMLSLQSPMQALLTCTVPRELQEDLQELGVYIADSFVTPPYVLLKKYVKGEAARS